MSSFAATCLRILKTWTLPVAIAEGAGFYLLFALVPPLAPAAALLGPLCVRALPLTLFLTLFVTFAKVDYSALRPRAWHAAVLGLQLLAVALLAVWAVRLPPDAPGFWTKPAAEALLVCVIAPCATATPVVAAKLGGDLTRTTAFVLLSSLMAALLIPAVFPLLEPDRGAAFFPMAWAILRKLAAVLLLPLVLGAIVRHRLPRFRAWLEARPDLGFHFWCGSLALTAGLTARNLLHAHPTASLLASIAVLSLAAAVAQFAAGRLVGRLWRVPVEAGQALFQKNTGLAIWIATACLSPAAALGAGCYVLWQNLVNAVLLARRH